MLKGKLKPEKIKKYFTNRTHFVERGKFFINTLNIKKCIKKYIEQGRSTPGTPQTNEGPEHWAQLPW